MHIHKKSKSIIIRVKNREKYKNIFGRRCREFSYKGRQLLAIKHGVEETKVLNNMGMTVPSPILHYYRWPGKFTPGSHQKATAAFLTMNRRAFVLNEAGTQKTASALWAADYLIDIKHVRSVLVVAKLSTLRPVWTDELFRVLPHRQVELVYGTRQKRLAALHRNAHFYVINHEGIEVVYDDLKEMMKTHIDLIILDEASDYRNGQTNKYKLLKSLIGPDTRIWPMTATPCPNAPTDAWALARLVNEHNVPRFFTSFKRQTMNQKSMYKWEPKEGSEAMAFSVLQPGIRFMKKDCLDLPPVVTEERDCLLSSDQRHHFREMMNKQQMIVKSGQQITAVNKADVITKLRQILCGVVKDPLTGEYVTLNYTDRFKVMHECIQEASAKSLVIVPFKGIVHDLKAKSDKYFTSEILNGDVSFKKRNEIITRFKEATDPHVLYCHPKVMAHGLNLTEADMLVFFAPIYSNDEFMQVIERFNRAGQTRKMTVIRIGGHPIEWKIYKALDAKQKTQSSILELYDDFITNHKTMGV